MKTKVESQATTTTEQTVQDPKVPPTLDGVVAATEKRSAVLEYEVRKFEFDQRRAIMFAQSGLFSMEKRSEARTPEEAEAAMQRAVASAMVRIELGESMGMSPAQALYSIDVIQGQLAIRANFRALRMQEEGYEWDVEWHSGKGGACEGATIWLRYRGRPMLDRAGNQISVSFLKSDAEKMLTTMWINNAKQSVSILEKDNWKMDPRSMYFARAITRAQRWYAPGVLGRASSLPDPEEVLAVVVDETERVQDGGSREAQREAMERKLAELKAQNAAAGIGQDDPKPTTEPAEDPAPLKVEALPDPMEFGPLQLVEYQGRIYRPSEDRTTWRDIGEAKPKEAPAQQRAEDDKPKFGQRFNRR